jgi:hypothetical protein
MKADSLSRRLAKLEDDPGQEDLVTVAHRWLNEDCTPASDWIERRIPRSRMFKLEGIDENENQFFE